MATVTLPAQSRAGSGKGVARKLRQNDRIPAVLYGFGTEPQHLSIDSVDLRKALGTSAGVRAILRLEVEGGGNFAALVKEIQRHPVTRAIIHTDLISIDLDKAVDVAVPIKPIGTSIGVKEQGGNLEWQRRELQLRVLPTRIPEFIELDISGLEVNQAIHVSDIEFDGGELLEDGELTICSVKSTRLSLEPEGEGAEGEGAADGEGGDAEAPAESSDE